jgi:hypothetical protein
LTSQEGWLAKYAVSEEDQMKTDDAVADNAPEKPMDPMQGLEKLEYAGPQPE